MTDSGFFPITDQIAYAASHRERAAILLRLSDAAVLPFQSQIAAGCVMVGFIAGQHFITWRVAALCATRDAHGMMPQRIAAELEAWRVTMSRFAAGEGSETAP